MTAPVRRRPRPCQNPIHIYQSQGTLYTITLVVSNSGGNDTRTRTVTVTP